MVSVLGRFLFGGRCSLCVPLEMVLTAAVLPVWCVAGGVLFVDISRSVPDD
jgi:hypothetical protein